jgi:hypothetical protein
VTGSLRFFGVIVIMLLLLASLTFVQAVNDPTAKENMYASQVTSKFSSVSNSSVYYANPNTRKDYYSSSSSDMGSEQTDSNVNRTISAVPIITNIYNIIIVNSENKTAFPVINNTTQLNFGSDSGSNGLFENSDLNTNKPTPPPNIYTP